MKNEFPEKGKSDAEILAKLTDTQSQLWPFGRRSFRTYSTIPHPLALDAINKFLKFNRNNIGTHTRIPENNLSALPSMEREVILMLGNLLGAQENDIDGYITQGGTEGNIMGLWMGRNMLRKDKDGGGKICVLRTELSHYSIDKAADILDIKDLVNVPLNEQFGMDDGHLISVLEKLSNSGFDKFILVLTLGYTAIGTADPIARIAKVMEAAKAGMGIQFYIHIDAAIGGLIAPFVLKNEDSFDFKNSAISSISLDMHKTGFAPLTAGAFLCHKDLQRHIERSVPYLPYKMDDTLSGSRPAVAAVVCWSIIMALGREGFKKIIEKEIELRNYLVLALKERMVKLDPLIISDPGSNILAVHFGGLDKNRISAEVEKKYGLVSTLITDHNGIKKAFYTIVFLPHITKEALEEFVDGI